MRFHTLHLQVLRHCTAGSIAGIYFQAQMRLIKLLSSFMQDIVNELLLYSRIRLIHLRLINPVAFASKLLGTEFSYSFKLRYRKFGY